MSNPNMVLAEVQEADEPLPGAISRRGLLGFAASAPVVTAVAGLTAAEEAQAFPLALTPPDTVDFYDAGDSIVQVSALTMPLVKLDIDASGVYTMALPRLETARGTLGRTSTGPARFIHPRRATTFLARSIPSTK